MVPKKPRQHFEAGLPWDTIHNVSLYISDSLHTHHFLTIKKHPTWSVNKQQNLKPITPDNSAYQGLPVLGSWSTRCFFYQESSASSRAEEQWDCSGWHVWLAGNVSLAIILNCTNPDTHLWVQTQSLTKEQMQREEVLSSQVQHLEGIPCPASCIWISSGKEFPGTPEGWKHKQFKTNKYY